MIRPPSNILRWMSFLFASILLCTPVLSLAQSVTNETDTTVVDDGSSLDGNLKGEVDALSAQVKEKEQRIKSLDSTISSYQSKVQEHEAAVSSLQNEAALLENRIQEKTLGVERTKQQIELANLEIQSLGNQIQIEQNRLLKREAYLGELIRQIQQADTVSPLDAFIARPSLSEFLGRVEELKRLEVDLADATASQRQDKERYEAKKKEMETHRLALQDQKMQLQVDQQLLEGNRSAKLSLISETQNSEQEFQRIVYELRQQQQQEGDDIAALQDRLKQRLDSVDEALARGDILLSWPVRAGKGISAHFHDPTYPFRKLFAHPGTDLPTPVGTPVHAAAGGYVAWQRTGKQYGNYIMLIHPGGIATVYAHLSRFGVKADTYVERGDVIGYSGGRPGDQGAGLSTGPHLHFEVRQNGIPVDAENYLPSLE